MTNFQFSLATPEDDQQLRQRMAEDAMKGNISISFRREPNYFAGCKVQGESYQILKCSEKNTGKIIALGSRLITTKFINGKPEKIGYLADLRVNPDYRKTTLLARGYRFLRKLHEANPVPLYYSVILEGNTTALKNLVGGRAGLPQYRDLGLILTPAIHLDFPKPKIKIPGVTFRRARREQLPEIFAFINKWQSQKQFASYYQLADFETPRLLGLKAEDFYVGLASDNRIVATAAAWNQGDFRQTHIEGYSGPLATIRPFYNLLAKLTPLKPLPAVGAKVPYFYLAFVAVENNDKEIFRGLLRWLYRDRLFTDNSHYFIAGLHEEDPLAAILKEYRRIEAAGRLFAVYFSGAFFDSDREKRHYQDGEEFFDQLDGRIPYIEIAVV